MLKYRGYTLNRHADGTWYWTDERGFVHTGAPGAKFKTTREAMDNVDHYKRNMRNVG